MHSRTGMPHPSPIIITVLVIAVLAVLIPVVSADIIPIASINDSYLYKEVTVSGAVVSIRSVPGSPNNMTLNDGSGTISVKYDSRLLETPLAGQIITVTGVYEGKGSINAKEFGMGVEAGFKDTNVADIKKYPSYYYGDSVRVRGAVQKIVLTHEKTELIVNDGTGDINVVIYGAAIEDLKLDDRIVVEGKCYENTISALALKIERAGPPPTGDENSNPSSTPNPGTQSMPEPDHNPGCSSESTSTPAFQIPVALVALFAIAYLLRRRNG